MGAMTVVYDLWFEREYPDLEDTELHIGIYATEADAVEGGFQTVGDIARSRNVPAPEPRR